MTRQRRIGKLMPRPAILLLGLAMSVSCDSTGPDVPAEVRVVPEAVELRSLGDSVALVARVLNGTGSEITDASVEWTSATPGVASVTSNGLVRGVANGTATVTATSGAAVEAVEVVVRQRAVAFAAIPAAIELSSPGETQEIDGIALDQGGSVVADAEIEWASEDSAVARVTPTGRVEAVAGGTTRLIAVAGEASTTVTVRVVYPLEFESDQLTTGLIGVPYSDTLEAIGGSGEYRWSLVSGAIPVGLTLTSAGAISGTPSAAGLSTFTVRVASGGQSFEGSVSMEVVAPLTILTTVLDVGVVGVAYSEALEASGGAGDYTWSVVSGELPQGLTLDPDGSISGVPTETDTTTFTARVAIPDGQSQERMYEVIVAEAGTPVVFSNAILASAYVGSSYLVDLPTADGGNGVYRYSVDEGALPSGVALDPVTGEVGGTPTEAGLFYFRVLVESGGRSGTALFSLSVSSNPPGGFNVFAINVAPDMPSADTRARIDEALASWEAIVTTDRTNQVLNGISPGSCGGYGDELNGLLVDDVAVLIDIAPNDGVGGVLGFAGPCVLAPSAPTTIAGILSLDIDDLGVMAPPVAFAVAWHEIGHVMGIGTAWSGVLSGPPNARFTGSAANAEYDALGGTEALVPVEEDGGPGTRLSHWDEGHFGTEIMTGYVNGSNQISRMTIGSLADIGWSVSYLAADPYSLPPCSPGFACVLAPDPVEVTAVEVPVPFEPVIFPGDPVHRRD